MCLDVSAPSGLMHGCEQIKVFGVHLQDWHGFEVQTRLFDQCLLKQALFKLHADWTRARKGHVTWKSKWGCFHFGGWAGARRMQSTTKTGRQVVSWLFGNHSI